MKRKILFVLFAAFVIIQFFRIDKKVPNVSPNLDFSSIETINPDLVKIMENACYDCHSYKTKYPWYAEIAPASWWIKGHIDHAREHLNFSTWGEYDQERKIHKLEECVKMVEEGKMPLMSYTWMHPEARLSEGTRDSLVNIFRELQ